MLLEAKIKLKTNFLGGGPRKSGIRQLKRTSDNRIAINENEWRSDFSEAASTLKIDLDVTSIKFEIGFECDKIRTLRRTYNKVNVELFEGIPSGTEFSLYIYLDSRVKNCPDLSEMESLLKLLGRFFGISQFGKKFHCGRFDVMDVTTLNKDNYK